MTARRSHLSGRVRPFPNIDFLASLRPTRMKLGLENITRLLIHLGEPQKEFPAILVGGTNGKGSVTTFISSMLRAAGLRVGTFYSPHLFRVNERIRVNGEEIPSPVLDEILGRLGDLYGKAPFTFFEGLTAAALLYFAGGKVDVAVFEVGLGGRLDATRLVNSVVTVVTGISRDHREHLGKTGKSILREKLGIAKSGVPMVVNLDKKGFIDTARCLCGSLGAPFYDVRSDVVLGVELMEPEGMVLNLKTPERDFGRIRTGMIGGVQAQNISTAVRTVEVLAEIVNNGKMFPGDRSQIAGRRGKRSRRYHKHGLGMLSRPVPEKVVKGGIGSAFFPGRFQVLTGKPRIVTDVSHNEEALLAALRTLKRISPRERNVLIFGVMANKELGRFPGEAAKAVREIILTPLKKARSAKREVLLDLFGGPAAATGRGGVTLRAVRGMAQAVRSARKMLNQDDTLLILGSHFAVEEAVTYL